MAIFHRLRLRQHVKTRCIGARATKESKSAIEPMQVVEYVVERVLGRHVEHERIADDLPVEIDEQHSLAQGTSTSARFVAVVVAHGPLRSNTETIAARRSLPQPAGGAHE